MKRFTVLLLLSHLVSYLPLQAQKNDTLWRVLPIRSQQEYQSGATGGAGEQHPHSIARCLTRPEYIYLSHDVGGSWRSTDHGRTWTKNLDLGLHLQFGQSIEVDPYNPDLVLIIVDSSYNYKAAGYEGIYRSTNGGRTWTHVLHTATRGVRSYRHNLAYAPGASGSMAKTWYAAFNNNGLYRSDDGGLNWTETPVSSLEGHAKIYEVRTHPVDTNTLYVASTQGLFVSSDRGSDLTRVRALSENVSSVCINSRHPDSIYATVYKQGIYVSADGGETFSELLSHPVIRAHMNPGFPEQIYLVGDNRNSMVTRNGGKDWTPLPEASTFPGLGRETGWRRWIDRDLSGIVPNPVDKQEAVVYTRSTIHRTEDGGDSFQESATGWTGNAWTWTDNSAAFNRMDPEVFAFFCNDIGTRITTTGGDWFHESTNTEAGGWFPSKIGWYGTYAGDFHPDSGSQVMVAAIGAYFKTQLMRSENLGQTWTLVTEGMDQEEMHLFVSFHTHDPQVVYAGNKYSVDGGQTFRFIPFPDGYDSPYVIGMCDHHPDVIYALDKNCTVVLRSCDRGQTWTEYTRPGWRFKFFDGLPTFAADPVDPRKIYTLDRNHDLACFDGSTWKSFNILSRIENRVSFDYIRNVAVDPNDPSVIYAGMFATGGPVVFRTTDGGQNWEDISYNLPRMGGAMKVNPHTGELYRGSMFGTWIFPAPYDEVPEPEVIPGFSVLPEADSLEIGQQLTLMVDDPVACHNASSLLWSSDNESVASVNDEGVVTAVGPGECRVTAISPGGSHQSSCHVFVQTDTTLSGSVPAIEPGLPHFTRFANGSMDIKLDNQDKLLTLSVYNMLGRNEMAPAIQTNQATNRTTLDVSKLAPGYYIMVLHTAKGRYARMFVR